MTRIDKAHAASKTWRHTLWAGMLFCLLTLAGCTSRSDTSGFTPPPVTTQADYEKRIQTIQNDPKMPPQIKAMAIGQIRAEMNGGKANATASSPGTPPTTSPQ
jgi:hypothetical protein